MAGGDTASALAAGCPVIAKAHPSHPGTSQLIGTAIQQAVASSGLHPGIFSLLHGSDNSIGEALVQHPAIAAVGFTGSRAGGLALVRLAAQRAVPIPVYAEMSSVNPVFLLPAALSARSEAIAQGFVDSMTLGAGQFCTQPGLVFAIDSPAMQAFLRTAATKLAAKAPTPMLNRRIFESYRSGLTTLLEEKALTLVTQGSKPERPFQAQAALFTTNVDQFLAHPRLADELFGPSSIVILCRSEQELVKLAYSLPGQLTATLHMERDDQPLAAQLLPALERKAGRILVNGFPTGVEVSYAMVHGGPFPATSDARTTSVGATAINRFLRPVCYQDLPANLLAPELQDDNPLGISRLVNGHLSSAKSN